MIMNKGDFQWMKLILTMISDLTNKDIFKQREEILENYTKNFSSMNVLNHFNLLNAGSQRPFSGAGEMRRCRQKVHQAY